MATHEDVKPEKPTRDERGPRYAAKREPMFTAKDITQKGAVGKVVWYNVAAGYGFIKVDGRGDDEDDVFVHHTSIARPNPDHCAATLDNGETVKFDIASVEKGELAANVTAVTGGPVIGNEKAPKKDVERLPLWLVRTVSASQQPTRRYGQRKNDDGEWVAKWTPEQITKRGVVGKVAWYSLTNGYGVVVDDNGKEYFVHHSSVLKPNDDHVLESLGPDETVKFDVLPVMKHSGDDDEEERELKEEAVNVTGVDGGAVLGHIGAPYVCQKKLIMGALLRQMGILRVGGNRDRRTTARSDEGGRRRTKSTGDGGRPRRARKTTERREKVSDDDASETETKPQRTHRRRRTTTGRAVKEEGHEPKPAAKV